jgi:hypothetical protein
LRGSSFALLGIRIIPATSKPETRNSEPLPPVTLLTQFVFRLSFGLATAMALTPSSKVTSGFYRNHLYVLLGLNTLAAAVALGSAQQLAVWPPVTAALLSYFGAVAWLYEKPRPGLVALVLVAGVTLTGAWLAMSWPEGASTASTVLRWLDPVTGGMVLGSTIAAMFLGHWYLNTPTMEIAPLRRLVLLIVVSVIVRAVVCGVGLALWMVADTSPGAGQFSLLALRWASGIVGLLIACWMTWQTLKIPNTQSATGILYVALLLAFLGELTSQLLSAPSPYPL